ncbi:hypothetical protein SLE2022_040100 [Rubroshorea leprosula]
MVGTPSCIACQLNATNGFQIRLKMLLPPLEWLNVSIAYPDLTEYEPSLECFHFHVSTSACFSCTPAPHPVSNLALPQFHWTLFPEIPYLRNVSFIYLLAPSGQLGPSEVQNS